MIPKIIHRVHLGGQESQLVKDAWELSKKINIDWEHITHNELGLENFPISKSFLDASDSYSFKSDLIRLEALYNWGGVYIDTDVFCLKSFNDFIDSEKVIVGYEDEDTIGSAIIIAPPKSLKVLSALNGMIEHLKEELESGFVYGTRFSKVFGPRVVTEFWSHDDDVIKLPQEYFYPFHWQEEHKVQNRNSETIDQYLERIQNSLTENSYCSHRAAGSWISL